MTPWRSGVYKATNFFFDSVTICGATGNAVGMEFEITAGDFGEASDRIREETGQDRLTIQTKFKFAGEMIDYGVISEDGLKITVSNVFGIATLHWMTDEEHEAYEAAKDAMEAPTHQYKEDPGNVGRLLWITAPSGMGKSTAAQLLAREHGFVYYEGDCFIFSKNPFIPLHSDNPSLMANHQKPLRGEGLQARQKTINTAMKEFGHFLQGENFDEKLILDFYQAMIKDLKDLRARIGGVWVVASMVYTRKWRDFARAAFGPDLHFVTLDMSLEDQAERLGGRHEGNQDAINQLKHLSQRFEPKASDEENTTGLKITPDMTPSDVTHAILEDFNKK